MRHRVTTVVLSVALAFVGLVFAAGLGSARIPGNHQGYEPDQPIAFSHRLHAGELEIPCLYCHSAAEQGRHAGLPSGSTCMNCHSVVTAPLGAVQAEDKVAQAEGRPVRPLVTPELQKLYDYQALDGSLQPAPGKTAAPVPWVRVHDLPDFAYFDHRAHVAAGVKCQQCHGPVETMERVRQVESLSMGWCVNCHRDANRDGVNGAKVNASIDCSTCHY